MAGHFLSRGRGRGRRRRGRPHRRQRRRRQQDRHVLARRARQGERHPVLRRRADDDGRPRCPDGAAIPIEERSAGGGPVVRRATRSRPPASCARHAAFDVTPARYVTAIVTDRGRLPRRRTARASRRAALAGLRASRDRPRHRDLLRRDLRRGARRRGPGALERRLVADARRTPATAASCPRSRRARTSRTCRPRSRARSTARRRASRGRRPRRGDGRPGLIGALLVGLSAGKALAFARGIPLVAREPPRGPPLLGVPAAGRRGGAPVAYPVPRPRRLRRPRRARARRGRTRIVPIARTRDDAPGEAFDKIARRARPRLSRAARSSTASPRAATAGRFPFPIGRTRRRLARLLLLGPEDGDAPRAPAPRRSTARRSTRTTSTPELVGPARVLPARDRRGPRSTASTTVHGAEGIRELALSGGVAANTELRAALAAWGDGARRAACACPSAPSRPTTPR